MSWESNQPSLRLYHALRGQRSIADALQILREKQRLSGDGWHAEIRTTPWKLPSGELTAIIVVVGPRQSDGSGWVIGMPSSSRFTAIDATGQRQRYGISRLEGAVVDGEGNVELSDGGRLRGIELMPTLLPLLLSEKERCVVQLTIAYLGAQSICYRQLDEEALPELKFLDYSALPSLKPPKLKAIQRYIAEQCDNDHRLPPFSRQTIATALSKCGMRRPLSWRPAA